ncbi:hypothetical protein BDA99DRAFT_557068 [Phascolomyces articulosus]|uniref:Actin-like ATPase domain-containing protein n=1 Tax=Phascolomyces articulosus TaxID=60185 RepID=A0AAD5K791_9FUNG|nr:hypothetical protein BDA99DRAFT_557068 [Phascolomyces articulosus]
MKGSNPQQKQQPLSEYKVVIAYDFGTTYSGAAYAFTHSKQTEVFDIQNWPNKGGNFYPKVPTLSVYPRQNQSEKSSGRPALSEWGHSAKKVMLKPRAAKQNVLLSQFKLQLDESLQYPPLENGVTPGQAVSDYLSSLHKHTLQELSRSFAKNYHPDTFRYCLTVPAVWSDKAKHMMRQSATQAGLITPSDPHDRLVLVSEPEAAALYCEETMTDQVELQDNDRIMICDAGGGTVDLIAYQVNFTKNSKNSGESKGRKRELKEVTKGMGESCGSVFLDNLYRELIEAKLGIRVMSKINPRELNGMMEFFIDTIKSEFNGVDDFFLELPRSVRFEDLPASLRDDDEDGYLDEGVLKLTGQELKDQVFDPVINKVLALIDRQYKEIPDRRLNFLFLVGGFGSSKYLYQRVWIRFQDTKVQVISPAERAALAVVRGAAYFGVHPQSVISRVSRRTYGINIREPFDAKRDPLSKRVVRPDETVDVGLYATEKDTVPRYIDEADVYRVGNITVNIPKMDNMKKNDKLFYTVRMYFGRTEIRMEADFGTGKIYDVNCVFDAINNYSF